jgi:hypothetical protein
MTKPLADALRLMRNPGRFREAAARQVEAELCRSAASLLRRRFPESARSDCDDVARDAIQRTLEISARTVSPFNGSTDLGARSWLRHVLLRELRRERAATEKAALIEDPDAVVAFSLPLEVSSTDVHAVLHALHAEVRRTHKGRAPAVWVAVTIYVESVLGASTAAQAKHLLKRRGLRLSTATEEDMRRAVRAVYRARYTGRIAGARALRRLERVPNELPARQQRAAMALGLVAGSVQSGASESR